MTSYPFTWNKNSRCLIWGQRDLEHSLFFFLLLRIKIYVVNIYTAFFSATEVSPRMRVQEQGADLRAEHHRGAALPVSPSSEEDLPQLSLLLSSEPPTAELPLCACAWALGRPRWPGKVWPVSLFHVLLSNSDLNTYFPTF